MRRTTVSTVGTSGRTAPVQGSGPGSSSDAWTRTKIDGTRIRHATKLHHTGLAGVTGFEPAARSGLEAAALPIELHPISRGGRI